MENSLDSNDDSTKRWLWVPCPLETFKPAYILSESSDSITVQSNTTETFKTSQVFKMNPSNFDNVEDLALLSHLNEPSVLHNLKKRYDDSVIYTYSGLFLISLNPYKSLNIYNDVIKKQISLGENYPHIFSIANKAYKAMLSNKESQSILITGESGAGKTENTKRVIEFITYISSTNNNINVLLQSTNPILEAFGNAKTIKNDNSSRFGKFIQLKFKGGLLCGARIEKYLLEKSRITHQNPNERTYHIFYYLLKGGSDSLLSSLRLSRNPKDYSCLRDTCHSINGIDDGVEFQKLEECFSNLNIESSYYKDIAAILHLSNIQFNNHGGFNNNSDSNNNGSSNNNSNIKEHSPTNYNNNSYNNNGGVDKVFIKDLSPVENACFLLNIPVTEFIKNVLYPTIRAGNETVTHYRSVEECYKVLEGLMRSIYESLFDRLIFQINSILDCNTDHSNKPLFIGVLDIAGFEIFKDNSFEQLCINYTNEKLQQFFNHHMFILEQEIYEKENIDWNFIDFGLDLEPTIKIIESSNPIGILSYLDEECVMPMANDDTLLEKVVSIEGIERIPFIKGFRLKHYAGSVVYSVEGWIEKNNDHSDSKLSTINKLSSSETNKNSIVKKGVFRTVAQSHRENLKRLMELLRHTSPHFVRCILPNLNKSGDEFDKKLILDQLRCNGVLEGIRISRLGYPTRISYSDFNQRYSIINSNYNCNSNSINSNNSDSINNNNNTINSNNINNINTPINININSNIKSDAVKILENVPSINNSDYRLGNTMVFLRQGILADIEDLRVKMISALSKTVRRILNSKIQTYLCNIHSERIKAISILQKNSRLSLEFLRWRWWSLYIKIKPLLEVQKNEENIRQKEEQLREYSVLIEKEREEKRNLENFINSINNSYEELKKSEDLLKLALSEKENLLEGLRKEKEASSCKIQENEKKIAFLQEKIEQCLIKEENHNRVISDNEEYMRLKEKYEGENLSLKDENFTLKNKLKNLEEKNISMISKISDLQLENDDLQFELKRKMTELSKKEILIKEKDSLLEENSRRIEELKYENEGLSEINNKNMRLKNEITEYENIIQSYNRQIENLREELSKNNEIFLNQQSNDDLIISLEKQIKSLSLKISNLECINKEVYAEREELYAENQRLSKERIEMMYNEENRYNKERKILQFEIQKLRTENEKLRNESESSHDENNILLEEERNMRRRIEKRLTEYETTNVLLENRLREYEREMMVELERYEKEYVKKEEIDKIKEGLNKAKREMKVTFELFQNEYFSHIKNREKTVDSLIAENSQLNERLLEYEELNGKLKVTEELNERLREEIEEFSKKNSLLKIELDGMMILREADKATLQETNSLLEKMKEEGENRERQLEGIIKEYNSRIEKINDVDLSLPFKMKIEELTEELNKTIKLSIEKDLEISILNSNLERCNLLLSNQSVNTVEIQKTIPVYIVDKESLKNMERRRILSCNCNLMNKVKIIESIKKDGEEVVRLNNENSILEMKLRQAERRLEDQERMIEGMKGAVMNLKTK